MSLSFTRIVGSFSASFAVVPGRSSDANADMVITPFSLQIELKRVVTTSSPILGTFSIIRVASSNIAKESSSAGCDV